MVRNRYFVVEENNLFTQEDGNFARTSALLDCAGVFIYEKRKKEGVLAHWYDQRIVEPLKRKLELIKLDNPKVVIAGCAKAECSDYPDSYHEVISFLTKEGIPITPQKVGLITQRVGLDHALELRVNFLNGNYRIRRVSI